MPFCNAACAPSREPIERQVRHRCGEQREHLRKQQATDDGDAERPSKLRAGAIAECQRKRSEQYGERRHHDRTEAQQARLLDCFLGREPFNPLRNDGEVDHQDRILLHDADEQENADERDDAQLRLGDKQRHQRANPGRRERCRRRRARRE